MNKYTKSYIRPIIIIVLSLANLQKKYEKQSQHINVPKTIQKKRKLTKRK